MACDFEKQTLRVEPKYNHNTGKIKYFLSFVIGSYWQRSFRKLKFAKPISEIIWTTLHRLVNLSITKKKKHTHNVKLLLNKLKKFKHVKKV